MKLVEFVPPVSHPLWKLCLQMGIADVIVKVNPTLTGLPDPWRYETLKKIVDGLKAEGLTVVGLEGDPFDMTPIKEYGVATDGDVRCPVGGAPGDAATDGDVRCPVGGTSGDAATDGDVRCPVGGAPGGAPTDGDVRCPVGGAPGDAATDGDVRCPVGGTSGGAPTDGDVRCPGSAAGQRTSSSVGDQSASTGQRTSSSVAARETALAHYRELLESMARLGIKLLCYNFMVGPGWSRSGVRQVRGGAKATYFSASEYEAKFRASTGTTDVPVRCLDRLILSKSQVWANYEYFIKSVMPTAERVGVRMGLHPDDPCLPSLGGYARIFETVADYDRAYAIYPSPSNAVTYCQANFKLMLMATDGDVRCPVGGASGDAATDEDVRCPVGAGGAATDGDVRCPGGDATQALIETARHFGARIAFIHVRDVEGDKTDFTELFHDQGTTDQFALMRAYREIGLDVPVRADHVPEMEGDRKIVADCIPGYFTLGRLFANGYLKALLQGTETATEKKRSIQ